MPPFTSGLLQRRRFFWQKNTPCKVNKQLSDKGMKFVQTTSDGGKVRMAFEEISGQLCGKLLPFFPKNRFKKVEDFSVSRTTLEWKKVMSAPQRARRQLAFFLLSLGKKHYVFNSKAGNGHVL